MQIMKSKKSEFNLHLLSDQLTAPNISYVQPYFQKEDPKELYIALNEFCYQLIVKKDSIPIIFWIDWILDFEAMCQKKKIKMTCARRSSMPVFEKDQLDPIWIIWEIVLEQSKQHSMGHKIIQNILELYCIRYTSSTKRKRKDLYNTTFVQ